jgi:predicted permease
VLSYPLWIQQFGGSDDVVGRKVQLGGEPFTVVGIAPLGFGGEGMDNFDAWIKASVSTPTLAPSWVSSGRPRIVYVFARIRDGVASSQVARETTRVYRDALAEAGIPDSTAYVELRSLLAGRDTEHGGLTSSARVALWLQAVAALLLVIAIANVVNLLLLRAMDRQRETAVCLALGISRLRLIRHLSLESLMLSLAGGLAAVALALWLGPALWSVVIPRAPRAAEVSGKLATIAAATALFCAILMTVAPALVQRAWSGTDALRSGARGATRRTSVFGDALVVLQVSLTVVLLVGAGLFTRSMNRLNNTDIGFDPARIVGARLTTSAAMDTAARTALFARVEETLRRMPGVQSVASGLSSPLRPSLTLPFKLPGKDRLPGVGKDAMGFPIAYAASPDFLPTLGIRLIRGRSLARSDHAKSQPVMLVDATMARTFWPNEDPIGRCVQIGADSLPCTTVVGIVQDTKRGLLDRQHSPRYYLSVDQWALGLRERYFFVRASRVDARLVDQVRATIAGVATSAPFVEAYPLEKLLDDYTQQWRLGSTAFVAFGVLATVVAAIGLFGVISFGVARREREFGIRRALGETRGRILRRIVQGAVGRAGVGLIVGSGLSAILARRLQELLFHPTASDSIAFVAAAVVVVSVTVIASAGPAARAMRADPMRALRTE